MINQKFKIINEICFIIKNITIIKKNHNNRHEYIKKNLNINILLSNIQKNTLKDTKIIQK